MRLRLAFVVLLLLLPASAQPAAAPATAQPAVTFDFDWSQGIPWQAYSITVRADGNTHFQGTPAPDKTGGDTDLFQQDFTMSEANRSKIFDLAQEAQLFPRRFQFAPKAYCADRTQNAGVQLRRQAWLDQLQLVAECRCARVEPPLCGHCQYPRLRPQAEFSVPLRQAGHGCPAEGVGGHKGESLCRGTERDSPILRKIADDPDMMHISRQSAQRSFAA